VETPLGNDPGGSELAPGTPRSAGVEFGAQPVGLPLIGALLDSWQRAIRPERLDERGVKLGHIERFLQL
jgi:hypothetical protein